MDNIKVNIKFQSGFAIHSGYGLAGVLDNTIMRDSRGLPYIPASTIKGNIREACNEVSLLLEKQCFSSVIDEIKYICENHGNIDDRNSYSYTTQIFGTPLIEPAFKFRSAYLDLISSQVEELKEIISWNEAHTSIDPYTGTALENNLFCLEMACHHLLEDTTGFQFEIEPVEKFVGDELISFLFCGIRMVEHIGASKTRGKGLVTFEIKTPYNGKNLDDWIKITFNTH